MTLFLRNSTSVRFLGWAAVVVLASGEVAAQQPRILPGTSRAVFSTIQGNALGSSNASLANAFVRLRDAQFGRSVGTQTTDGSGLFAFRGVDPGNYVVEILSQDQAFVLAASQVLTIEAGQTKSAVVKLPYAVTAFAQLVGSSTTTAATVATNAALAGVMTTGVSGTATCDTLR
jgi:hypothetical protein